MKVFLLIGQSNMAGPQISRPSEKDDKRLSGVFLLNEEDSWELATNPLNKYSTIRQKEYTPGMSPGVTFAETLKRTLKNEKIGLVCNARGSSKIAEWQKGIRAVNKQIRLVNKETSNTALIRTKGAEHVKEDLVHFSPKGMRTIGRRYAKAFIKNWLPE